MASLTLSLTDTLIGGRQTIQQVIVSGFPFFFALPPPRKKRKPDRRLGLPSTYHLILSRGYTSDFFACDGDAIFWKIVASTARGENRMCSHPRTGNATDEKISRNLMS